MGGTFGFTQHTPGILIPDRRERIIVPNPAAIRDALIELWNRVALFRFEQKEMAVLVNHLPTKTKEPIDAIPLIM